VQAHHPVASDRSERFGWSGQNQVGAIGREHDGIDTGETGKVPEFGGDGSSGCCECCQLAVEAAEREQSGFDGLSESFRECCEGFFAELAAGLGGADGCGECLLDQSLRRDEDATG
jgi:hypothetical protein